MVEKDIHIPRYFTGYGGGNMLIGAARDRVRILFIALIRCVLFVAKKSDLELIGWRDTRCQRACATS